MRLKVLRKSGLPAFYQTSRASSKPARKTCRRRTHRGQVDTVVLVDLIEAQFLLTYKGTFVVSMSRIISFGWVV